MIFALNINRARSARGANDSADCRTFAPASDCADDRADGSALESLCRLVAPRALPSLSTLTVSSFDVRTFVRSPAKL